MLGDAVGGGGGGKRRGIGSTTRGDGDVVAVATAPVAPTAPLAMSELTHVAAGVDVDVDEYGICRTEAVVGRPDAATALFLLLIADAGNTPACGTCWAGWLLFC